MTDVLTDLMTHYWKNHDRLHAAFWKSHAYYWRMKYESLCADLSKPERVAVARMSEAEDKAGYKGWSACHRVTDDWAEHTDEVVKLLASQAEKS